VVFDTLLFDHVTIISMQAKCCVYVNRLMAFCIEEILKCFVNCSTCKTACPIDRIIKPRQRVRPPTRLSCSNASIGKWFSLWALQPVASVAGRDACVGMRPEPDRAAEKMLGTWDRRWSIVKLSVKPSSRNPISREAFGFRRSVNDRFAMNFPWLFRNRDNENIVQFGGWKRNVTCKKLSYDLKLNYDVNITIKFS